ncbi:MAG: DUF1015 domain-containing protein [Deltaproteobacteria bacterium]|nr:MAG: DUF1015 domain-containing protein [Deltaproteobacteria bacterium]
MAKIAPFRGLYYNPQTIADISLVVTPPYDVIPPEDEESYRQRHPYNIIRIILPEGSRENKYTEASNYLHEWERKGILIRDEKPSFYLYQQIFASVSGEIKKRDGFVSLIRIEPWGEGKIIPHERTTPKPVEDRLQLMEACGAHLSQVFSMYSDPAGEIEEILAEVRTGTPRYEFRDDDGVFHRLWQSDDQEIILEIGKKMVGKTILIADGHHRYSSALIYRDRMREKYPSYTERSPFECTMMYLTPLEREGLLILPTHRLIPLKGSFDFGAFLDHLREYFSLQAFNFEDPGGEKWARESFFRILDGKRGDRYTFGLYIGGERRYLLLTLKDGVKVGGLLRGYPEVLRELDVVLLDKFLLKEVLQVEEEDIGLTKDRDETLEEVHNGRYTMVFLMNPPTIQQVKKVADVGEVMPRKSTYFYPKVATGLAINKIVPNEEVEWI